MSRLPVDPRTGKVWSARIASTCGFLCSTVSSRDVEHMTTGLAHSYDDYRSYGAGPVANYYIEHTVG